MFQCCLGSKKYSRMTDETPVASGNPEKPSNFISSINVYSSRTVSVVEALSNYHGDEKLQDTLHFIAGDIIHVIEKNEDYFVGFLQTDVHKNLGRFPANLCQVHKSWLKEKWSESTQIPISPAISLATQDSSTHHIVAPKYSMNASTYVDIII